MHAAEWQAKGRFGRQLRKWINQGTAAAGQSRQSNGSAARCSLQLPLAKGTGHIFGFLRLLFRSQHIPGTIGTTGTTQVCPRTPCDPRAIPCACRTACFPAEEELKPDKRCHYLCMQEEAVGSCNAFSWCRKCPGSEPYSGHCSITPFLL